MINRVFEAIGECELQALVEGQVSEDRTLEFKRELKSGREGATELLRDMTAFANGQGGDLLIGVEQTKAGVASAIIGVEVENLDTQRQTFELLTRDRTEPRLSNYQLQFIPVGVGRYVIHFRIAASLAAPHAVRVETHRNYFMRNSIGKHEMDANELRDAFTASEHLFPRLRGLHEEAIERSHGTDMPFGISHAPRCVLSVIPRSYLRGPQHFAITRENALLPFRASNPGCIPSLEGLLTHSLLRDGLEDDEPATVVDSYVLNHWSGRLDIGWVIGTVRKNISAIEQVRRMVLPSEREGVVWPEPFEQGIVGMTRAAVSHMRGLGLDRPWVVFASLEGLGETRLAMTQDYRSVPSWRARADLSALTLDDASPEVLLPYAKALWLLFGQDRPADRPFGE